MYFSVGWCESARARVCVCVCVCDICRSWPGGHQAGEYLALIQYKTHGARFPKKMRWDGSQWFTGSIAYDSDLDGKILCWIPMPSDLEGK